MTLNGAVVGTMVAILLLLVLSALFSGSETALTTASRARMHHLKRRGNRRAALVSALDERRERLLGTILLGNNFANILASALATSLLISWFGDVGVAYATVAMTILILIFSEILPKTYAILNADRTALWTAPIIRVFVALLGPFTVGIQAMVRVVLRISGAQRRQGRAAAEEEIRGAIDLFVQEVGGMRGEGDMLGGILDLAYVDVSEIMVHRKNMFLIDAAQPTSGVVAQVLDSPYTRIPLWKDDPDNIIGVLHVKDVLKAVSRHDGDLDSLDIVAVATEPWFLPDTTDLRAQLTAFRRRKAHFAMVVDEYGVLMGLVTLEDILEEIVGDIDDEHDVTAAGVRVQADGSYIVDGTTTLRDLNRRFGWTLPDEEAATLAGLVVHEAQVIPNVGQVFTFHGFRFEALRRQRNQITALRVTPPPPAQEPAA